MENGVWYKVDNVAKVFLASYNKRDTRSFRLTCTLKEKVDPVILQEALHITSMERPQYQVEIHKGLFWHYMEVSEKEAVVKEEYQRPCPLLYGQDYRGCLHYSVTYWRNRINLEMFHALTDGTGGLEFLNIIIQNYLKLKYPEKMKGVTMYSGAAYDDLEENSFSKFYGKNRGDAGKKAGKSYQIKSIKLPYDQQQFFEAHMSVKEVLAKAKGCGASMTAYLGALLALSIYEEMPALVKHKKPVTISMPVNLRNFYPSETSRNFFNSIYISHVFNGAETIEELAHEFDKQLKEEIAPETVKARMDSFEKLEHFLLIRVVPLFIKNPVVKFFSKKEQASVSAIVSNVGKISVPDEVKPYIESYAGYCSTDKLFITVVSYEDDLVFGIASVYRSTRVLKNFIRSFTDNGIKVTVSATEVLKY
ncbi:MAG: hypothetical protein K6G40_04600 [Eubacterium sp.]|nr:hypothetical protein [Eubacterium sp.]